MQKSYLEICTSTKTILITYLPRDARVILILLIFFTVTTEFPWLDRKVHTPILKKNISQLEKNFYKSNEEKFYHLFYKSILK